MAEYTAHIIGVEGGLHGASKEDLKEMVLKLEQENSRLTRDNVNLSRKINDLLDSRKSAMKLQQIHDKETRRLRALLKQCLKMGNKLAEEI